MRQIDSLDSFDTSKLLLFLLFPHVIIQKSHRPQSSFRNCSFCLCIFVFHSFFFFSRCQQPRCNATFDPLFINNFPFSLFHTAFNMMEILHTYILTMLLLCCLKICSSLLMVTDWKIASPYTQKIVLSMAKRERKKYRRMKK